VRTIELSTLRPKTGTAGFKFQEKSPREKNCALLRAHRRSPSLSLRGPSAAQRRDALTRIMCRISALHEPTWSSSNVAGLNCAQGVVHQRICMPMSPNLHACYHQTSRLSPPCSRCRSHRLQYQSSMLKDMNAFPSTFSEIFKFQGSHVDRRLRPSFRRVVGAVRAFVSLFFVTTHQQAEDDWHVL